VWLARPVNRVRREGTLQSCGDSKMKMLPARAMFTLILLDYVDC
jgi:hypothetical protein